MAVEERRPTKVDRVVEWLREEKDSARKMKDCSSLDPGRRAYWTTRYETLSDVYYRLTGRLEV